MLVKGVPAVSVKKIDPIWRLQKLPGVQVFFVFRNWYEISVELTHNCYTDVTENLATIVIIVFNFSSKTFQYMAILTHDAESFENINQASV